MQPSSPSLPLMSLLLAVGVSCVWGFNFVVVTLGLHQFSPITLCALRFFFASIPAIFFIPRPNTAWKYVISYGLITFCLQFSLLFGGMAAGATPGIAALISQSQVFFAIFFAYLFAHQRITRWQMMGAFVSFAGILVIALHRQGNCSVFALCLLLSGSMVWGLGNLISTRLKNVNMLSLVIWSSFIAILPTLGVALVLENPLAILLHPNTLTWTSLLALTYITYLSTHFGYGGWSWLLSQYPVASIAPFALLSPIVALISSSYILGESFESWKMMASTLVIAGLCFNIFGQRLFYWIAGLMADAPPIEPDSSLLE